MSGHSSPHSSSPAAVEDGSSSSSSPASSSPSSSSAASATTTSAVTRGITDLHLPTWLSLIATSAFCRTALQHPLNVALSRKRISDGESPSLKAVFSDAFYNGESRERGGRGKGGETMSSTSAGVSSSSNNNSDGSSSSRQNKSSNPHQPASSSFSASGGVRNLYRGFGMAACGNMVGEVFYLVTVEAVRHTLRHDSSIFDLFPAACGTASSSTDAETSSSSSSPSSTSLPTLTASNLPSSSPSSSSSSSQSFAAQVSIDAAAGMIGDVMAMLVCTPLSVAVNKQMTAGYGLNRDSTYRSAGATLREMWHAHPREGGGGGGGGTFSGASSSSADANNNNSTKKFFSRKSADVLGGLKGWYAGLSASLFMLPSSGVWWASYGQIKRGLYATAGPYLGGEGGGVEREKKGEGEEGSKGSEGGGSDGSGDGNSSVRWYRSPTDNPVINGMAGVCATLITTVMYNPVSVIRTRLQALPPAAPSPRHHHRQSIRNSRIVTLTRDLIKREGYRGLFKGTMTNASVSVVDGLLFATLFELTKYGSDVNVHLCGGGEAGPISAADI